MQSHARLSFTIIVSMVFSAASLCFAEEPPSNTPPAGFSNLFNGKDLTGWKVNENTETFTIKDGAIVAHGNRSHCFYVGPVRNHDFKDFELKVDVMTAPGSNGGIYFHTAYQDVSWPDKGFEVQVNNTHTDPIKSGSLYHVVDIGKDVVSPIVKDNEWFTEHIVVTGKTVTISLNGKFTYFFSWIFNIL